MNGAPKLGQSRERKRQGPLRPQAYPRPARLRASVVQSKVMPYRRPALRAERFSRKCDLPALESAGTSAAPPGGACERP